MYYVENIVNLLKEIDHIDEKIVEKSDEWNHAYKMTLGANSEAFMAMLQRLDLEHDLEVEGLNQIFQATKTLAEDGRAG